MATARKTVARKVARKKVATKKAVSKQVVIKKQEVKGLKSSSFRFQVTDFQGCCQAEIIYELWYNGEYDKLTITSNELQHLRSRVCDSEGRLVFAVTSSEQLEWELVLKKLGFEKQRSYVASTGSLLTAWVFVPEDQSPGEDDFPEFGDEF